jgi:sugar phosphate isomerase/epimerase
MSGQLTRRQVLATAASVMAASGLSRAAQDSQPRNPICVFTKPFNSLSFHDLADRMAELDIIGIEAPIRKDGNVEPEEVEDKLPQLVEALKARNLEITVMTSDINDASDPMTERVLRAAAMAGIRRYRMKYLRYDLDRSVARQLREFQPQLRDLAAMNRELGITAVYQNHAGRDQLGAALWDLPVVLEGISPRDIGVAYDIRHATVEGGMSWPITFNRIRPHVEVVYVKDFKWEGTRPINVPLGEGNVDSGFFSMLAKSGFTGPISLHEEYLNHQRPELVPQHLAAIKQDVKTLKNWLK